MDAIILNQFSQNYTENLMNEWGSFMIPYEWGIFSGSGSALVNNERSFKGYNSLKITNSSTSNPIDIWSGFTQDIIDLTANTYYLSFSVWNPNAENITGRVKMYDALTLIETFEFDLEDIKNEWVTFGQLFTLASTNQIQFSYEIDAISSSSVVYIDAVKVEVNDRGNSLPARYVFPKSTIPFTITVNQTLNFGTISANDYEDLTVEVIGAVVGDAVVIGYPALTDHYIFTPFVTATDEVTIRCCNPKSGSVTVPSGNFKVKILK